MEMQSITYQCPNCNGALEYDNEKGRFRCFYCDSHFDEQQIKEHFAENESMKLDQADPEQLSDEQKQIEEFTGASALYSCPNCGAGVICTELEASVRCHFCHTPVILSGRLSGEYKPDLILPFATTREAAEASFKEYTKGKFLLPGGFKKNAEIIKISALYVPYWLKSGIANVHTEASCTKVRTWRVGDVRYTNTKYYSAAREADLAFIRVPCDGSKRIEDSLMESIEPFNYSGVKPFSMSYLSGCAAEKYDVPMAEAEQRIDARVCEAATELMKSDIKSMGYTTVNVTNSYINYKNKTAVYALLPVWFLNYRYGGKDYPFVMNGQTGQRFGVLPVSKLKTALFAGGVFLATLLIGLAVGWLMNL